MALFRQPAIKVRRAGLCMIDIIIHLQDILSSVYSGQEQIYSRPPQSQSTFGVGLGICLEDGKVGPVC